MLKKFSLLVLFLGAGSFALGYYYWKQATGVPQWYAAQQVSNPTTHQTTVPFNPVELQAKKTEVLQNIDRQIADQRTNAPQQEAVVRLERQELNNLIVTSIAEKPQGQKFLEATQGIQTKIEPDKLEVGAVVNLDKLNSEVLSASSRAALENALQNFPAPLDREIYIGIEGVPTVENGRIKIDNNTKIKVGNLSFSVAEVAQQFGVSPESLAAGIERNLDKLAVSELQLEQDRLLVKGTGR